MNIAFVMDPIDSINYEKDTSYFLMLGAQELGHTLFHIDQGDIFLNHDRAFAKCSKVKIDFENGPQVKVEETMTLALEEMALILVRKDPPFDRRYFYTTLILDYLPPSTLVANSPQVLRDWNEKLSALEFPEFCPQTIVSSKWEPIQEFALKNKTRLVLKPIDGNGGKGIEFADYDQENLKEIIQRKTNHFSHQLVVQTYLPEADQGDVRVIFCNDQILGSFIRIHAEGKELNNLDQGATAHPWKLTPKQKEISELMGPIMYKRGAYFTGIDFIGDTLIEINVTSTTGLQELSRYENKKFHHIVIDTLLKERS